MDLLLKTPFWPTISEAEQGTISVNNTLGQLCWPPCLCKKGRVNNCYNLCCLLFSLLLLQWKEEGPGCLDQDRWAFPKAGEEMLSCPCRSLAPQKCSLLTSATSLPPAAWAEAMSSCPSSSPHVGFLKAEEDKETI